VYTISQKARRTVHFGLARIRFFSKMFGSIYVTDSAGTFRLEIGDAHDAVQLVAVCPGHLPGRLTAEKDPATGAPVWPRILVLHLAGPPLSLASALNPIAKPRRQGCNWIFGIAPRSTDWRNARCW
jgi:hypothetical protein